MVGTATDATGNNKAFRWTQATGMVDLGTLVGGVTASAYGVSANGNFVVGQSEIGTQSHAVLWTVTGSTVSILDLGTLAGGLTSSAYGVSTDGTSLLDNRPTTK